MDDKTEFNKALGAKLRTIRCSVECTQSSASEQLGMSSSAWSRVESGNTSITVWGLRRFCLLFDENASEILAGLEVRI